MVLKYENEIVLIALLSDFERFYLESKQNFLKKYKDLFQEYCDMNVLIGILEGHAEYKEYLDIILEARKLSLTQTDKSKGVKKDAQKEENLLVSVFARVSICDNNQVKHQQYAFDKISPESCMPSEKSALGQKEHKENFDDEMKHLLKYHPKTFSEFLIPFEALLKKYLWCISASDYEGEDISLYDHARITAGIALCLYRGKTKGVVESNKEFVMAAGTFSGIQKYIFSIASVNHSNVSKRLRARSFFVDATVGAFAQYIIDQFELCRLNILMLTGGKFYILLPNTKEAAKKLKCIEHEISKELYSSFKGQLGTNLAWITVGKDGLEQYDKTITQLSVALNEKKNLPFESVLHNNGTWDEGAFVLYDDLNEKRLCKACDKVLIQKSNEKCDFCSTQEEMGKKLPNAKYLVYSRTQNDDSFQILKDYYLTIETNYNNKSFDNAYYIEKLNDSNIEEKLWSYPITFDYKANHVKTDEKGVLSFDILARKAAGKKYIGVLKADVDNLGFLFSLGLKHGDKAYGTISRVNTMSRLFTIFFSGKINQMLETDKYGDVYSVFAGGDDLFLIGPWDVMPDLAEEINEEFRKFVSDNKDITLSATVDLYHPKTHISTMAELSEEHLKRVKETSEKSIYPEKDGRNGIQFFTQIMSWDDFEEQMKNGRIVSQLLRQKKMEIDNTFIRRIQEYSQMYQRFVVCNDKNQFIFKPRLHYVLNKKDHKFTAEKLKRKIKQKEKKGEIVKKYEQVLSYNCEYVSNYLDELDSCSDEKINKQLFFSYVAMKYAWMITREDSV